MFLVNGLGIKTWVGPRLTLSFLAHCPVTFPPYTLCHCHLPPPQRPNQWTAQFWSWTSKAVSLINPYSVITSLSQVFGCSSEKLINAVNNGSFAFLLPLLTIFPFLIGLRLLVQCWITITAGLYVYKMIYYFIYLKGWGLERDRKPPPSWFTPQMSADLGVDQWLDHEHPCAFILPSYVIFHEINYHQQNSGIKEINVISIHGTNSETSKNVPKVDIQPCG